MGAAYARVPCGPLGPMVTPLLTDVECGQLQLGPSEGSAGTTLPVLRISPRTEDKQPDPVIVLAGGPGQSGIAMLRALYHEFPFQMLLSQRDVIAIGSRGTSEASPALDCHEVRGIEYSNKQVVEGQADKAFSACRDRLSPVVLRLGSQQDAMDVLALVDKMGLGTWNVYALSYGTRAALELLRLNPAGLRAVVLDSPVPDGLPLVAESVARGSNVLVQVLEQCNRSATCAAAFPDISATLDRVLDRFANHPETRRTSSGATIAMDDSQVWYVLQSLMSSRQGAQQVPAMIAQLDGDLSRLDELLEAIADSEDSVSDAVYLSVACREIPVADLDPAKLTDRLAKKLSEAARVTAAFARLCNVWGASLESTARPPPMSDVPVLILTGELDPATPPEWGMRAATGLPSAQVFTVPGEGHVPGDSICGTQAVRDFMRTPGVAPSLACLTAPRPLRFVSQ
jgi:pimeloyl-ACP methyl ester carboxylesterase